ncbi:MAG: acyl-CoA dehydrogenase family protein [Bdellovibrionota bacterium]
MNDSESFARSLPPNLARPVNETSWRELLALPELRAALSRISSFREAGAFLEGISRGGADMGVPLTFTVHLVCLLRVLRLLAPEVAKQVAASNGLCCMGASEPKVGSHPGKIQTTAKKDGSGWIITGQKTFTTGGPLASMYLILAICGESSEGRDLGVFLVPRDSSGLSVSTMPPHVGPETALHANLKLENVRVPLAARLGPSDREKNGWTEIAKPFRQWEDSLLSSWVAGLFYRHASELRDALRRREGFQVPAGRFFAYAEALSTLAKDAAQTLDEEIAGADFNSLILRRYASFEVLRGAKPLLDELSAVLPSPPPEPFGKLRALLAMTDFAKNAREKIVAGAVG